MDMADAVNLSVFARRIASGEEGIADWWAYAADDADAIRAFLRKRFGLSDDVDPINSQLYYLDSAIRDELREDGILGYYIPQRAGELVVLPAGCPHQVSCLNLLAPFLFFFVDSLIGMQLHKLLQDCC